MESTTIAADPFPSDSGKEIVSTNVSATNPNSEPTMTSDGLTGSQQPDCLFSLVVDSTCGAIAGSVVGYGSGLIKKQGFKGSVAEAVPFAKMFAVYSCVKSLVESYLKRMRGKHDVYSACVAGCCAGIALSFQGGAHDPLQSCVLYGAVSSILEGRRQRQPTMGQSFLTPRKTGQQVNGILPPLSLPLPDELKDSFSSFCKSLHRGPR